MNQRNNSPQGFTYSELLIAFGVLVIFGAIAIPAYINYLHRQYYNDIKTTSEPWVKGITNCYQTLKSLKACNGGMNHVPANQIKPAGKVQSISVSQGVITITPITAQGITANDTLVQTPVVQNNAISDWKLSGGAVTEGYVP